MCACIQQNEIIHYQIRRHGEDAFFSIDDQIAVHGLDELIKRYQNSWHGLVTQLMAVIPDGSLPPSESRRDGRTTLLHRAIKGGDIRIVRAMLQSSNQRTPDAKDQDGRSVMHLACLLKENAESILDELIACDDAKIDCRDLEGNTPLHVRQTHCNFQFVILKNDHSTVCMPNTISVICSEAHRNWSRR